MLLNVWGGEKKLSVGLSIFVIVLNVDASESLSDGSSALVSGEDSLAWSADLLGGLDEFFLEGS